MFNILIAGILEMEQTLKKVGGSVLATIPSAYLKSLRLHSGSTVDVQLKDGAIVIRPADHVFPYSEAELFEEVSTADHRDVLADSLTEAERGGD